MTPGRRMTSLVAAVVGTALLVGCAGIWSPGAQPQETAATGPGFVKHAGAVAWPASSDYVPIGDGLRILLPVGNCVLGIGTYRNGYRTVGANWTGNRACTALRLDPAPHSAAAVDGPPDQGGWPGGGITGDTAIVLPDGTVVAASTGLERRAADGSILTTSLGGPESDRTESGSEIGKARTMAVAGRRLLIGGGETVGGQSTPMIWTSDDSGRTVRRVVLPGEHTYASTMATDGSTVLATEFSVGATGRLRVWRSGDAGGHWTGVDGPSVPANSDFFQLIRTAGQWWLAGSTADWHPLLLHSPDGIRWTASRVTGAGGIIAAGTDRAGKLVLLGQIWQRYVPNQNRRACGVIWVGDGTTWKRTVLGCGEAPPLAMTTLADGRLLVAGNHDLWLRAA